MRNRQPRGMALRSEGIEVAAMHRQNAAAAVGISNHQVGDAVAVEVSRCHGQRHGTRRQLRHRLGATTVTRGHMLG